MTAEDAPCRTASHNYWFPASERYDGPQAKHAKMLCRMACPERADCLARALDQCDEFGIFGGLDPQERKAILVAAGRPSTPYERDVATRRESVARMARRGLAERDIAKRLGVALETIQRDLAWLAAATDRLGDDARRKARTAVAA